MRYLLVIAIALAGIVMPATPAEAATICPADAFAQYDMVGTYISVESLMRVQIYPCGSAIVTWDNAYGRHTAAYMSYDRLVGDGLAARGTIPDPESGSFLDASPRIAFKAGSPGYLNVGTFSPYSDDVRVYRLKKVA